MKRLILLLVVILCFSWGLIACEKGIMKINKDKNQYPDMEKKKPEPVDEIKELMKGMTIEEKVGQLLIVGIDGTVTDENIEALIKNKYVGGIILFSNNVSGLTGVNSLINNVKQLNRDNKVPLFISVDEEGGIVSRTPNEFLKIPPSLTIGQLQDEELCYEVGGIIAEQLKVMGYNMDYAPVLDILSNMQNTVIGNRSFGREADIVSRLGISTMKGLMESGIIPVVKHFPGHGDTAVDSHYGLPLVEKSLEQLKGMELIPFQDAIENGADAIMVAHILMSQIDNENPASMSKEIISNLLREEMGFEGVVLTDDMTMGAVINNYDIAEAAVKSINSGADIVLVCHGYDNENKVYDYLLNAINTGIISEERLNESVYRILKLKMKYDLSDEDVLLNSDVTEINNKINNVMNKLN